MNAASCNVEGLKNTELEIYREFDAILEAGGVNRDSSEQILTGVFALGYECPLPVQQKAIVPIIQGRNTITQAQSGQGKTGAFAVGTLGRLSLSKPKTNHVRALVVVHTREVANQIGEVFSSIGKATPFKTLVCVGGKSVYGDIDHLKTGEYSVVVGTIGRINDLLRKDPKRRDLNRIFDPKKLEMLILDEFDKVLDSGGVGSFDAEVKRILDQVSEDIQISLFSATVPKATKELISFMHDPTVLLLDSGDVALDGIKQFKVEFDSASRNETFGYKVSTLLDIIESLSLAKMIIFCRTGKTCEQLHSILMDEGFACSRMDGKFTQDKRERILKTFKDNTDKILISTNVLARGIDIQHIALVINFDLPTPDSAGVADYLHRIGRSGRLGRKGFSISFISSSDDRYFLTALEKSYKCTMDPLPSDFARVIQM